jgi:hypothetical protein
MEKSNSYPQFYKQGLVNRFIKRVDELTYIMVQVIGYENGSFVHLHSKHQIKNEEKMQDFLNEFTTCSQEEYETMIEAFFYITRHDREKYKIYKQQKWQANN